MIVTTVALIRIRHAIHRSHHRLGTMVGGVNGMPRYSPRKQQEEQHKPSTNPAEYHSNKIALFQDISHIAQRTRQIAVPALEG